MKKTTKNAVKSIALTAGFLLAGSSVAYAESVLGGDWYYGTNYVTGNATTSFYHGSTTHWTSVGTSSGKYARASADAGETASTWLWRTPGSSVTFQAGAYGRTIIR
ncbi:lactococcin 972 family bacteriocin [Trueperella pyogenes]